ncbi:MAG: alpha/beta fold hydrolase [Candidatus Nanopelagicales bacterium]
MEPTAVPDGLAVYVAGSGEPVLFMPGPHRFQRPGLFSADELIDGLVGLGRQVVTFDPPSSGLSTRTARLGIAEMLQCAREALAAAGVTTPVDALGHSMGGLALLSFALDSPQLVRRLVLVGTGTGGRAYMDAPGALWNRGHRGFPAVAAAGSLHLLVRRLGSERVLNNLIVRHSFQDESLAQFSAVRIGDWFKPARGRADWHRIARRIDLGPLLGDVRAPALVVCGRHDPQFPLACSIELAEGIHGARLVVLEHSGHFPFIEEPADFWAAVRDFLAAA